jgi:hypothetical protein
MTSATISTDWHLMRENKPHSVEEKVLMALSEIGCGTKIFAKV